MSERPAFASPFHRPQCLAAAAAPAGKAKLTHPGKAILAGKTARPAAGSSRTHGRFGSFEPRARRRTCRQTNRQLKGWLKGHSAVGNPPQVKL